MSDSEEDPTTSSSGSSYSGSSGDDDILPVERGSSHSSLLSIQKLKMAVSPRPQTKSPALSRPISLPEQVLTGRLSSDSGFSTKGILHKRVSSISLMDAKKLLRSVTRNSTSVSSSIPNLPAPQRQRPHKHASFRKKVEEELNLSDIFHKDVRTVGYVRSGDFVLLRSLLRFVDGLQSVGEINSEQKTRLKSHILTLSPEVMHAAMEFDASNDFVKYRNALLDILDNSK